MNINILKKVLSELDKPEPNLFYIKGMVETLIELSGGLLGTAIQYNVPKTTTSVPLPVIDFDSAEEEFAKKYNGGPAIS